MCLFPKLVFNPKYKANKKNGGKIPAVPDVRILYVPVGCGNCMECRKQKARGWQVRLLEDLKEHKNGKFVTFTFSNNAIKKLVCYIRDHSDDPFNIEEGYALDNRIAITGVRLFLERWRKKYKKSLRHWLVTELGHNGTENIHLHGIIWTDIGLEILDTIWGYGFIWKGNMVRGKLENYVNERTINYITKYVSKMDLIHQKYKAVTLTSAGIGRCYRDSHNAKGNKYIEGGTDETYRTRTGHKISMPVYWRNKIYTEEEREKLWLEKLDKNERWVLGTKIDISKGQEEYYNALVYAQDKNKRLGYGNNKKNWNREKYEHERRKLIQNIRLGINNDSMA